MLFNHDLHDLCLFCLYICDFFRFGRRFATLSSLFGLLLCGVGTAFSPNIYVYMVLKFFCGVTGVLVIQATVIGKFRTDFKPVKKSLTCRVVSLHDAVIQEEVNPFMIRIYHGPAGIEWTGPSHSAFCTTMILLSYPVGLMLLPGIAYLISNWRTLQLIFFSPLILLVGFFYWSASFGVTNTRLERIVMNVTDSGYVSHSGFSQSLPAG